VNDRFSTVYEKYGSRVYARCRRLLRDSGQAEDATQEVFVKVAKHLDKVPGSNDALMWIQRIATNHCLNELRNAKRRPRLGRAAAHEPVPRGEETVLVDRDLARRIIARLPRHLGASAWLRHVDGMSHLEIGQTLGLSRRTIFNYLAEFHQRTRMFLRNES
jgi:RNA polymerase sigma-70 factor (ECF subfamily)